MIKRVILSSGNEFYYLKESNSYISHAYVKRGNVFLGGFLGKEADRKFAAFSNLSNTTVEQYSIVVEDFFVQLNLLDKTEFSHKLGTASSLFLNNFIKVVNDLDYCDGTSSKAQSCDERRNYYKAVGTENLFRSNLKFNLGLFIANHLAVFSVKDFRETFFKGCEEHPQKDVRLYTKTRYYNDVFKAPAAYVRALCQSL